MKSIKEILKKVRKIELKTKGLSSQVFSGAFKTTFKGRGMSFSEVREYQYGDDVRNIDWNVTARTNKPHVKVFEEEHELNFMLLVDVSGSAYFGANSMPKNEFIAEVAATLAFSAAANNDKVGAIFFSDKIEAYIPPKKGKNHILRIIREILFFEPQHKGTNVTIALKYLTNLIFRRCTAFVLSDFLTRDYEPALKVAAKRHDLIGIHIYDERETELPNIGLLPIVDAESGQVQWVDTSSSYVREQYSQRYTENLKFYKDTFMKMGADALSIGTHESYTKALMLFFKERKGHA